MNKFLSIIIITFCSLTVMANDGQFTELVGSNGEINWTKATVSAIGYGIAGEGKKANIAPYLACRAAKVDAQRNLLESYQGVRVTSTTLVSNYMLSSDEIKSSVEGTVKGATIKSRDNRIDGSCKVVLQASLRGKISKSIYQDLYQEELSASIIPSSWSFWMSSAHAATYPTVSNQQISDQLSQLNKRISALEQGIKPKHINDVKNYEISGIIIDVRGTNFRPSLNPKIRKASGEILYPNKSETQDIIDNGQLVSLFSNNVSFAMDHPTVGDTPLLIKAKNTWKNQQTEIALSDKDAEKLSYLINKNRLKNMGFIIIL
ncbi:MAG: LPP20 family lipoprotein [Colwellia sp.]|nr:LPP20 family lipoprotein [Colwellia sp.]